VPATSAAHNRLLFFFLLQPFTVLMKQTRPAVRAIKQSIFLDVYGTILCILCQHFEKILNNFEQKQSNNDDLVVSKIVFSTFCC